MRQKYENQVVSMKQFRNKIMLTTTVAIYGAISGSDDSDAFVYVVFINQKIKPWMSRTRTCSPVSGTTPTTHHPPLILRLVLYIVFSVNGVNPYLYLPS